MTVPHRRRAPATLASGSRRQPTYGASRRSFAAGAAAWAATLLLAGCALAPALRDGDADVAARPPATLEDRCERAYAALDRAVAAAGVGDAEAARVAGFPYLRADRLLASLRPAPDDAPLFAAWVQQLATQDDEARRVEIANLPVEATARLRRELDADGFGALPPAALLAGCGTRLRERDLATPSGRRRLLAAAVVPDDYDDALRALGAYPLTALPFAAGVRRYEAATHAAFALPLADLPRQGVLRHYQPRPAPTLSAAEVRAVLARARDNPLRLPLPDAAESDALLATFAPLLVIDERDNDDRVGRPRFDEGDEVAIDTAAPVLFTRIAHTRFGDELLLQLVYTAWFPARRATSSFDLLAGRLDALVWRVTLAADGTPLLHDSIHACGCYHLFFPSARLAPRPLPPTIDEGALTPQRLGSWVPGARIALRIESGTHYLRRVVVLPPSEPPPVAAAIAYGLAPDDALRTLPRAGGGTRSLYAPDGLVRGSERGERFVFWPMGIASAGAMRQWGRHATAFVGRRHFDEPRLIERYFEPAAGSQPR
ncbi:MAG: hypothetical protein IPJ62_02125 [Betaproteobacteria bacterium]|nr:hypothetical protein [Betaproteobacteria bacterium]